MNQDVWEKLRAQFERFPVMRGEPASRAAVDEASQRLGLSFPSDYREFLERYGAGLVGAFPVFGLSSVEAMGDESVVDVNQRFRSDHWPGVEGWLILSEDHAGNPIGADADGRIWISDHGRVELLADSFEAFILRSHDLSRG